MGLRLALAISSPQPLAPPYAAQLLPLTTTAWQHHWEHLCTLDPNSHPDPQRAHLADQWRRGQPFSRTHVTLSKSEHSAQVILAASHWLELDSLAEGIRFDSDLAMRQEVAYAQHLGAATILLPPPLNPQFLTDYARAIKGALLSTTTIIISIRIPIAEPGQYSTNHGSRPATPAQGGKDEQQIWESWNTIRDMCEYDPRLTLTLDLTNALPPSSSLVRWGAEPIQHIYLPCTTFIPNAKGYPVLPKSHQAFLKTLFRHSPTVILSGPAKSLHTSGGPLAYAQYLLHLERSAEGQKPVEVYARGYEDNLQEALQPLMDNLEGETYEGFEKDPVKYRLYEEAVYRALLDRPSSAVINVYVVGAGRGPLVAGCLSAAERAGRKIKLLAMEKNANAFVILQERNQTEWSQQVELVFEDMRNYVPPVDESQKADLIVSELLGSFGDNEGSPECLDGCMRCLKVDGLSIPSSYTSFLAPIASPKLHASLLTPSVQRPSPTERPYVVSLSAYHLLSSSPRIQEAWGFDHPRPEILLNPSNLQPWNNQHNSRVAHLTFQIKEGGVCHGFGGWFEAVLYGDIGLSIHPERNEGEMLSWFPAFFPLRDPLYLPENSELEVHMWRLTDQAKRKVWFEWSAAVYIHLPSSEYDPVTNEFVNGGSNRQFEGQSLGGMMSPMSGDGAFASAPSPRIGSGSVGGSGRDSGRMSFGFGSVGGQDAERTGGVRRVKVGMSRLQNPGGRSSWIGL